MKRWLFPIVLWLGSTLACSLSPATESTLPNDPRPVLRADQPAVVLLAPQAGSRFVEGAPVILLAEARDLESGVVRIEVYDHFDQLIDTVEAEEADGVPRLSGQATWQAVQAQQHFLKVRAFRADGTASNTAEVMVLVEAAPAGFEMPVLVATEPEPSPSPANDTATAPEATAAAPDEGATPDSSPEPTTTPGLAATVVDANVLNIRLGPSVNANIVQTAARGAQLTLVGRTADSQWYATPLQAGGFGWVFGQYLAFEGDPSTLPVASDQQ
ncbi:MAG: SH3 domain-containing protein [Anaerolineae bacterium]|nr:SH3 domain-containing protein [Anaerolineae bacterium]